MNEQLSPQGDAALLPFLSHSAQLAREAFLAGARIGSDAFSVNMQRSPMPAWREAALARYAEGSWKHTVIGLIPAERFRPSEISTGRRSDLERRHPGHNNPSVGTANTLAELVNDGVVAKVANGVYAPAIDGEPVPPAHTYRPRSPVDESYALQVGYAQWTWTTLEWQIYHLGAFLDPSFSSHANDASDGIAAAFRTLTGTPRREPLDSELKALAAEFDALLKRRKAFLFARPATRSNHRSGYAYTGAGRFSGPVDWSEDELAAFSEACEEVSRRANALYYSLRSDPATLPPHAKKACAEAAHDLLPQLQDYVTAEWSRAGRWGIALHAIGDAHVTQIGIVTPIRYPSIVVEYRPEWGEIELCTALERAWAANADRMADYPQTLESR